MKYSKQNNVYRYSAIPIALLGCLWTSNAIARPALKLDNQTNGTYVDPLNDKISIKTTSNTVSVNVREIAGIAIVPVGITRGITEDPVGQVALNDLLYYGFEVQNTGNDPTRFSIPAIAGVSSQATLQKVQYFAAGTWKDIPTGPNYISDSIDVNGKLRVRVVVKVTGIVANNDTIDVILGNAVNPPPGRIGNPEGVFTADNPNNGNAGEIDGSPNNGEQGAQATQKLNTTTAVVSSLKNGPKAQPAAVGPTDDGDDFTNKSTSLANLTADNFNPNELIFDNTVINNGNFGQDIKVIPQVAKLVNLPSETLLPDGTMVTLTDPENSLSKASFVYKNGIFVPNPGSPAALVLKNVGVGSTKDYQVTVDLPENTPQVKGFPIALAAFVDLNGDNQPNPTEAQNSTIDRAYTGMMQVTKESRVLDIAGVPVSDGKNDGAFSATPKKAESNRFIEYRITYKNISTLAPNNKNENSILSAANFKISEDGRVSPNNWAERTTNDPRSAASTGGSIEYETSAGKGLTTDPAVVKYINIFTTPINPGETGVFTFKRKVI